MLFKFVLFENVIENNKKKKTKTSFILKINYLMKRSHKFIITNRIKTKRKKEKQKQKWKIYSIKINYKISTKN